MKISFPMIIFLFIAFIILYIAYFIFYDYIVRFFGLSGFYLKRFLILFCLFAPIAFTLSMIAMHISGSTLVRAAYFLTGLWHGVLVNFLIVIFFSWFFIGLLKILGTKPEDLTFLVIGIIGVIAALAFSFYGFNNALKINKKEISVEFKNLPKEWVGKKAIHITDVHLGSILRNGHMNKIIKVVDEVKPDIIFITGDLFDSIDGHKEYFENSLKKLSAPKGVYFVTGNHETYQGHEKIKDFLSDTKITILDNKLVDLDGLQVIGLAYPERFMKKDIVGTLNSIDNLDFQKTNILLYHEPRDFEIIKQTGIDLMLSGHTHKGQMWPFNYITENIFKGYDYGLFEKDDFSLYVSSGAGVWGPTMRTSGKNEVIVIEFK